MDFLGSNYPSKNFRVETQIFQFLTLSLFFSINIKKLMYSNKAWGETVGLIVEIMSIYSNKSDLVK